MSFEDVKMANSKTEKQLSVPSKYEPLLDGDPRLRSLDLQLSQEAVAAKPMFSIQEADVEDLPDWAEDEPAQAVTAPKLNQHLISCTAFTRDAKGEASFFSALFKQEAKLKQVGVVQEAKAFTVREVNGVETEVGVAVRLQVEASEFSSDTHVSIPNIAAEAQLGMSRAQMEISVRGFAGPLGDLLPAPESVNLTSYAQYLEAFQKIQKHVFSKESQGEVTPVVLGQHRPPAGAS